MTFTAQQSVTYELTEATPFGTNGRTTLYRTIAVQQTGADRERLQTHQVSAGLSAHEISLDPLGVCATSNSLLVLWPDKAIDVRLGASDATLISAVQFMILAATLSSIFVTTPASSVVSLRTMLTGGSNATIRVSPPAP